VSVRRASVDPFDDEALDAALQRAIEAMENGAPFKAAYEALLLDASDDIADRLMQVQREARATWMLLLRTVASAERRLRALVVGNALTGASIPLGHAGFATTLFDRSPVRLRFAQLRNASLTPGDRVTTVVQLDDGRLPFDDATFDLVVQESALGDDEERQERALAELRRVCAGELVLIADNRFAYKRSSGRRGVFRVPSPIEYARKVLTRSSERSLAGYRDLCAASDFEAPRAFALYPDAREFTFVVGLDSPLPRLEVGPKERDNKLKMLGASLGLFPLLTPSFGLFQSRRPRASEPLRVERMLDELARRTGEPRGELEHLVATRGNSALLLTRRGEGERRDDTGWWCVHVGLSAAQRGQLATHARFLERLERDFPHVPSPRLLHAGEIDGLHVTCERRARGLTAPQLTGELDATRTMLADAARWLAELVVEPSRPLDDGDFERLVAQRFRIVAQFAGRAETVAHLERLLEASRAALVGRSVPRVLYHADLRSKHIQVDEHGRIEALLDWGSGEESDLPYFDLLHLVAHERKQAEGWDAERAWELVRERVDLRDYERAALDEYSNRLGLDDEYRRAIEAIYPVFVAAMAERHWDYSRPRWLHRQFGV